MGLEELKEFTLVEGTALALHLGHRISVDLDLFSEKEFNQEAILASVRGLGNIESLHSDLLMLSINDVKVDMIHYPYPFVYPVQKIEGIRLAAVEEIAAMKLSAIANRGAKKDFFDFYELLTRYSLKELINFFSKKFPQVNPFYAIKSLSWFDDADEEPDPIILGKPITWLEVKSKIEMSVKDYLT